MADRNSADGYFAELARRTGYLQSTTVRAPSRLKAKIYSALVQREARSGPLASLSATKAARYGLCVFESLMQIAPVGERVKSLNPCRVCHARILAELVEDAPLYWKNCPYADFQKD